MLNIFIASFTAAVCGGSIAFGPTSVDGFYDTGNESEPTQTPNSAGWFTNWSQDLSGTTNPPKPYRERRDLCAGKIQHDRHTVYAEISVGQRRSRKRQFYSLQLNGTGFTRPARRFMFE